MFASTGQGFIGCNMFAYCNNRPVISVDSSGRDAASFTIGWGSTMWWLHFVDGLIPAGDAIYWLVLGIASLWAISASPFKPQDLIEEGENALSEARSYAKSAYSNHDKYVVHHIVAKAHPYAKPARDVLESVGIDPITNGLNFAIIPERVHKHIHTKKYLFYVNSCFDGLYGDEEAVIETLSRLEFEIQLYSNTGFKRW